MSVVERCQFEVTFSVTIGNPILSSYVRRRKMSVWGYIQFYNRKPYIKQLCQTSKDVSMRLHCYNPVSTAISDVERCQFFGCISCYIQKPFVKQLCQTRSKDVSLRMHCYNPISSGYVRRQNMLLCGCIAGCVIFPDCDERNLHCGRCWVMFSNQRAMTGLIRTVITKRQRRRFLHTIPDTKHDSDSFWSAWWGVASVG